MKKIFTFFAFAWLSLQLTYGQGTSKPFITTWTIGSNDLSHSLIMTEGFAYDFSYVWKDASNGVVSSGSHTSDDGDFKTTFQAAGTYTLEISGTFPHFNIGGYPSIKKLADVKQWGNITWQSMNASFYYWSGAKFSAMDTPDLKKVTTMESMFDSSYFNQDISGWNVSNVTNMRYMFYKSTFNQDINGWNVSNVTDMTDMFGNSSFNQDISGWNVSNVTDMSFMFYSDLEINPFNQDISGWDVSNVTDMQAMFYNSYFNQDISGWNVSNVTDMSLMFYKSYFNQDISSWNVGNVTDMQAMFKESHFSNLNYDKTLMGWARLDALQRNVKFDVGTTTFCKSEAARKKMINNFGWDIIDAGQACSSDTNIRYQSSIRLN
ncbi:BspA family leucine-rich repeat surface protein [Flavobacterium sp. W22_SRS_FK3]|uniref:BspA family leucine-rich repeat surface protein n=1 Tax=Flavobacterium sp. W22_SRS_FK3 TaxID=3240275 RepID=UPI003F903EF4